MNLRGDRKGGAAGRSGSPLALSGRTDNRLDDMPMVPVACRNCGAKVLARKSSWIQTSVQWNADASSRCTERQDSDKIADHRRGLFLVCSALRESIEVAVATGDLAIVDAP